VVAEPAGRLECGVARRVVRPEAQRACRQAQHERGQQERPAGLEGADAREHRAEDEHGAGREQRDGDEVAHPAEQPDEAVREGLPHLSAVPAEIEDEGEEDRRGHERETEEVLLALVEHGQARAREV
jgi:hypothetical protein